MAGTLTVDNANTDTIAGKSNANNMTINSGNITIKGEGTATTNLQQGLCKAWMSMNGTSTIALFDSFNTASITDNGSGDYTQVYTNAMSNIDYSVVGSVRAQGTAYSNVLMIGHTNSGDKSVFQTTSNVRVTTNYAHPSSANREDRGIVNTQITGDLA
tara:strand:- start:5145 stop:5618 length:474 start_codon:yes stop_codon:yes gene_type:complete